MGCDRTARDAVRAERRPDGRLPGHGRRPPGRPTLVLNRTDDPVADVDAARDLASHIEGAPFVEFAGDTHPFFAGPEAAEVAAEIQEFVTGSRPALGGDRAPATVLFTDIVDSTKKAAELGDHAWRDLVERHHRIVRDLLARSRGIEMDTAGDGFFATFDGPARAVRCALAAVEAVRPLGIEIRAGVHTGEVGDDRRQGGWDRRSHRRQDLLVRRSLRGPRLLDLEGARRRIGSRLRGRGGARAEGPIAGTSTVRRTPETEADRRWAAYGELNGRWSPSRGRRSVRSLDARHLLALAWLARSVERDDLIDPRFYLNEEADA